MKKEWRCYFCGHSKKESEKAQSNAEAFRKRMAEGRAMHLANEHKIIASGKGVVGDCEGCRKDQIRCDYSCVGV